ncbi:hypothetical protein HY483_01660 [Candidatus Woesearchaeota archaeon]|nr:hypothetical protein [Candidatus Woesearchaeota archaeon]
MTKIFSHDNELFVGKKFYLDNVKAAQEIIEMSETAIRNLSASARSKKAVSDHDQEPHAPGFSPAVLDRT